MSVDYMHMCKIRKYLHELGLGKEFLDMTLKAQSIKEKN